VIGWGAIALLYYPMLEAPTGKTVGKHLITVRVASADRGRPPTHAMLTRTLTRIIDVLPASVLLALSFATTEGNHAGDLAIDWPARTSSTPDAPPSPRFSDSRVVAIPGVLAPLVPR